MMELASYEADLKAQFEPIRAHVLREVRRTNFGWTPCAHTTMCAGWCADCLALKAWALRTVEQFGEPGQ